MQDEKRITTYRQELRVRILEKAMSEFAAHGIKAVKMDDIAQMLGISKRTLYELFDNKEVLLFEGVKKFKAQRERESLRLAAESDDVMDVLLRSYRIKTEEFRQVNPLFFSDLSKYPSVLTFLDEDKRKSRRRNMAFLERGIKEGYFRSDVDYDLVLQMLEAMGDHIMRHQLYRQYTIEHLFKNLMFVSLRGFCTKKGVDVLDKFMSENV